LQAAYDVDPAKVFLTPLGIGPEWFETEPPTPAELAARRLPERYFLFVGNLEPRKNVPVLLDAYRLLLDDEPDAPPLVLAGPAAWGPALDTAHLPANKVVFTGYVEGAALRSLVAGALALVLPSRDEGFGLPPLEALACGVRPIVSDLPVLRENLGEQAVYVPVGDAGALAHAMRQASESLHQVDGIDHARRFTWKRCAHLTMTAYAAATHTAHVV
jgi:glycosyltransferase involved in cell wall biosynthesis